MSGDGNYEVDDAETKGILRSISGKIGQALKPGWGFILMLSEYGAGGAMFYASNVERAGATKAVREWLEREEGRSQEINPEHRTTAGLRGQWHKIVAMQLMREPPGTRITITQADLDRLANRPDEAVVAKDSAAGLELWLVDRAEARRLAREENVSTV